MSALIFTLTILAVAALLALGVRRWMLAERKRRARRELQAQLDRMTQAIRQVHVELGRAVLPAFQDAARAFAALAAAVAAPPEDSQ